ncbi:MAG: YjgP/YjgQ family permease [Opitutus sp.]|nr:YjgP/YjgQ family permease [Opitutus sp.]
MNTFDRHLLREWLQILGLVLAATCGLLLIQVLYDKFQMLREIGARGRELWEYIGVTMPSFLAVVLPIALLVSLLYTLGKLHRANEFNAMRAAGVGFIRLTAPIWLMGLLCCGLTWWLNTSIVPWSVERSEELLNYLRFRHESKSEQRDRIGVVFSVAFDNRLERRMWYFNRYSRYNERGYGASVSELDPQRREVRRLVAAEAWYDPIGHGWVFKNGRELLFTAETGELIGSKPFVQKFAGTYQEDPQRMLLIDRRAVDLSLHELHELIDYLESERSPKVVGYAVRYFGLIADTIGPLIVIAIAIPFAMTGVRVNPAVGVSKSIGLFVLYYLLSNFAASLASREIVEPVVAAWLPHAGMAAVAAWFFVRMR